ncbi:MAG: hypothetical protein VYA59_09880, partial [Pseudomonadota bacterium]|nr:hypothetical protein [Pseudomonadota bacterium]
EGPLWLIVRLATFLQQAVILPPLHFQSPSRAYHASILMADQHSYRAFHLVPNYFRYFELADRI